MPRHKLSFALLFIVISCSAALVLLVRLGYFVRRLRLSHMLSVLFEERITFFFSKLPTARWCSIVVVSNRILSRSCVHSPCCVCTSLFFHEHRPHRAPLAPFCFALQARFPELMHHKKERSSKRRYVCSCIDTRTRSLMWYLFCTWTHLFDRHVRFVSRFRTSSSLRKRWRKCTVFTRARSFKSTISTRNAI